MNANAKQLKVDDEFDEVYIKTSGDLIYRIRQTTDERLIIEPVDPKCEDCKFKVEALQWSTAVHVGFLQFVP